MNLQLIEACYEEDIKKYCPIVSFAGNEDKTTECANCAWR